MSQPISLFNTRQQDALGDPTNGVAVSSTNTYYSLPWSASKEYWFGLHIDWTGTPNGTFTLWASDKPAPILTTDADWVQDTTFAPTNPAGSSGKFRDNVANGAARWWRVKYVNSSSSGTVFGYVTRGA